MIHKITRQSIEQAISEEIMQMDQEAIKNLLLVELMPGTGFMSGLKGVGQGIQGMFQSGRAPALAQKMAEKYSAELDKLAIEFVKSYQNFEKDYKKWGKNKSVKQILDNSGIMDSYNTTAGGIMNTKNILDQIAQQQVAAQGGDQAPPPEQPDQTPAERFMGDRPADLTEPVLPSAQADLTEPVLPSSQGGGVPPTLDPQHLTELPPEQASAGLKKHIQDKNPNATPSQIQRQTDRMTAKAAQMRKSRPKARVLKPLRKQRKTPGKATRPRPSGKKPTSAAPRAKAPVRKPSGKKPTSAAPRAKAPVRKPSPKKPTQVKPRRQAPRRRPSRKKQQESLMRKIRFILNEDKKIRVVPTFDNIELMKKLKTILGENKKVRIISNNG